jgi:hypothetical protein
MEYIRTVISFEQKVIAFGVSKVITLSALAG